MSWLPKSWVESLVSGAPQGSPPGPHTHPFDEVEGLTAALNGKQPSGSYSLTSHDHSGLYQPAGSYAASVHAHGIADVTGLQGALDGKQAAGSYSLASHNHDGVYALVAHSHAIGDVTGLQAALDGKQASGSYSLTSHNHSGVYQPVGSYAAAVHTHAIADTTGLQAALDGKQAAGSYALTSHNHDAAYALIAHNHTGVYEPVIAAGTAAQYWRGDKTWQTLPAAGSAPSLYRLIAAHSNSTLTPSTIGNAGGNVAWTHTLVSGKTYRFTVAANHQTAALTTGGRMNLLGAGGLAGTIAGMMWGAIVQATAASTLETPLYSFANGAGSFLLTTAVNPINAPHIWGADFVFHCTTGGTLSLQWASEVNASAAQLNIGSCLIVEQLN
jgi:hypothetical protein